MEERRERKEKGEKRERKKKEKAGKAEKEGSEKSTQITTEKKGLSSMFAKAEDDSSTSKNTSYGGYNQWDTANLGSSARNDKFMRLWVWEHAFGYLI